MDGTLFINGGV